MKHRYLEAGKIVNTHGIAGEVKIMPWADDPDFLLNFKTALSGRKTDPHSFCTSPQKCCADEIGRRR